jgi:hypothetical protein
MSSRVPQQDAKERMERMDERRKALIKQQKEGRHSSVLTTNAVAAALATEAGRPSSAYVPDIDCFTEGVSALGLQYPTGLTKRSQGAFTESDSIRHRLLGKS